MCPAPFSLGPPGSTPRARLWDSLAPQVQIRASSRLRSQHPARCCCSAPAWPSEWRGREFGNVVGWTDRWARCLEIDAAEIPVEGGLGWLPTAENVNALPEGIRRYGLVTARCGLSLAQPIPSNRMRQRGPCKPERCLLFWWPFGMGPPQMPTLAWPAP